jgi:hypothetical protein
VTVATNDQGSEGTRSAGWAYVSIVSAIPGISLDPRVALPVQFLLFEGATLALAHWYDLWPAVPVATVAVTLATVGSGLMVHLRSVVRSQDLQPWYRSVLFESGADVAMGLVAFITLLTYVIVGSRPSGTDVLEGIVGVSLPAPALFLALVVAWDLCYRIGVGWLASVTGCWRSLQDGSDGATERRRAFRRADALTIVFALTQLVLVPFLTTEPLLATLVLGHVVAVVLVSGLAIGRSLFR